MDFSSGLGHCAPTTGYLLVELCTTTGRVHRSPWILVVGQHDRCTCQHCDSDLNAQTLKRLPWWRSSYSPETIALLYTAYRRVFLSGHYRKPTRWKGWLPV